MVASHRSCSKNFECSCEESNRLVEFSIHKGQAVGSRMTGAGEETKKEAIAGRRFSSSSLPRFFSSFFFFFSLLLSFRQRSVERLLSRRPSNLLLRVHASTRGVCTPSFPRLLESDSCYRSVSSLPVFCLLRLVSLSSSLSLTLFREEERETLCFSWSSLSSFCKYA